MGSNHGGRSSCQPTPSSRRQEHRSLHRSEQDMGVPGRRRGSERCRGRRRDPPLGGGAGRASSEPSSHRPCCRFGRVSFARMERRGLTGEGRRDETRRDETRRDETRRGETGTRTDLEGVRSDPGAIKGIPHDQDSLADSEVIRGPEGK
ncbi:hypothetical protein E2C01_054695 [Portunus trituberculatus]|uniref:Uncharacterized protein n=1 Tax=Portunus trituberculatus TaxID=210409 RepID=A0A5B7GKJ8_PORTR|nr:hypothetical protein [Portunus trituberculatus]